MLFSGLPSSEGFGELKPGKHLDQEGRGVLICRAEAGRTALAPRLRVFVSLAEGLELGSQHPQQITPDPSSRGFDDALFWALHTLK